VEQHLPKKFLTLLPSVLYSFHQINERCCVGKVKSQVVDIEELLANGADAKTIQRVLELYHIRVEEIAKIIEEMKERDDDVFE
jgi:hypothetical protein